ncbi:Aminodeoxychorismate synthase component 2 [Candidatus Providencia siddallii]|uniref:Aminodeoxychorismate synthase component 2 n=1 Tax=Candidatus Providencia siddallii TaxID=1715285 RepID=A0A0M6W881_9GAMM|nr:Aminodeoxychorismate synthase component 2 [Candidatus Providencia siddallii]
MLLLIIDNYDSFTYNLYQYFCELGASVIVKRNNEITLKKIEQSSITHLVISPGPGAPNCAGVSLDAIKYFAGKLPILGVCLGHQAIGQAFGASIVRARKMMHGKTSIIYHNSKGIFNGIKNPLVVTRYHSLVISTETVPESLSVSAWSLNKNNFDEIMGVYHKEFQIEGIQFHPESILTEQGYELLNNFLKY